MKKFIFALAFSLITSLFQIAPSSASIASLSMALNQMPSTTGPAVALYGQVKPAKNGIPITVQVSTNGKWQDTGFTTKTARVGTWKVVADTTVINKSMKYRVKATLDGRVFYSQARSIVVKPIPQMSEGSIQVVSALGPGNRIHGADVSRWQHPNDAPINFVKMYNQGVRFVIIKASDSRDESDALSLKYLMMDRHAAQAAGLLTGFYHYASLPDSSDTEVIESDATTQAQKVIWRLASIGGYTSKDLPYALDLENNCVGYSNSECIKYATRASVTLWAKTFLRVLKEKTGRTPILYSYPSFLEGAMNRDAELATYPLWLAHYGVDPAVDIAQPGLKTLGCYVHSWTAADCSSHWSIWQYTSCGIAPKYGVPGNRLDLNVFRGSHEEFLKLAAGTWVPQTRDFMPTNETSTLSIKSLNATTTDKSVVVKVEVFRPTGLPVVTGTVRFYPDALSRPAIPLIQSVTRSASGAWTLSIQGLGAGIFKGKIGFVDATGTHAQVRTPIEITLTQGVSPSPSPTATPLPAKPQRPVDNCAKQIKN